MRRSKKKIILSAVMLLLLIGLVWGIIYLKSVADYKQVVKETTFEEIDISEISDGIYIGEYDVNFIYAKVEVTVQNGEVTNINLWSTGMNVEKPQKRSQTKSLRNRE